MNGNDVSFRTERTEASELTEIALTGVIDERSDLSFMRDLHGRVRLDLGGLRRINSHGVRTWMTGVASLPNDADVELANCPPAFVDQLNLVSGFCAGLEVVSILAPYECERCLEEADHPVDIERCRSEGALPRGLRCEECGGALLPNEIEDLYLRFLEYDR